MHGDHRSRGGILAERGTDHLPVLLLHPRTITPTPQRLGQQEMNLGGAGLECGHVAKLLYGLLHPPFIQERPRQINPVTDLSRVSLDGFFKVPLGHGRVVTFSVSFSQAIVKAGVVRCDADRFLELLNAAAPEAHS